MSSKADSHVAVGRRSEAESLVIGPTGATVLLAGAATNDAAAVLGFEIPPGFGPPPHRHDHTDHVWLVRSGALTAVVDGAESTLEAGDCVWIPRSTPHTFRNDGDEVTTFVEVDTGRAVDGYFRDLADAFPAGASPDPAVIGEIMRRHDTEPVG